MSLRWQNDSHLTHRTPSYYANNKLYKDSYARTEWPTRTSRRIHDGLSVDRNYGLDTVSDDLNSSIYSSPYYINGRYNSNSMTTQRGNSASVQGCTKLASIGDTYDDFTEDDAQTIIQMWQGKQIKFEIPYNGKVVGHTITLRNKGNCRGILSIYVSAKDGGPILSETAIDLCSVSEDNFEHREVFTMTPILRTANPRGKLYIRMEIWDDLDCERSTNPFNTGRVVEIAATGIASHQECIYELGEKNVPVEEKYEYVSKPSRPCFGLIYNNNVSVPVERIEGVDLGATVSIDGYDYDIFCYKDETTAHVVAFDRRTNKVIPTSFPVDGRVKRLSLIQEHEFVYYVDGYSPLHRFKVGDWNDYYTFPISTTDSVKVSINADTWVASGIAQDSGTFIFSYNGTAWEYKSEVVQLSTYGITLTGTPNDSSEIKVTYIAATQTTEVDIKVEYYDARPVLAPSGIIKHNNRAYLYGFDGDKNLVQESRITAEGPDFNNYPYRFYVPSKSPKETSTTPIVAIVETSSDQLMILTTGSYSLYTSNVDLENAIPSQVSTYSDGAGVASAGDVLSYRGIVYSFDPDEGLRYFTGALWKQVAGQAIDTLFERVDMDKPRKLWGYAYKLYFNYYDRLDGKAKCIVHDMSMDYQQYPYFMDSDIPFCDVRTNNDFELVGIHPDYPCIMRLYDQDVWRRLDTPITFERWTKYISLPGNAADMMLRRVQIKVLANTTRWWNFGISIDQHDQEQHRGKTITYRIPSWDTIEDKVAVEEPFATVTAYSEKAIDLLTLPNLNARAISTQVKTRCKTFRSQANLVSVLLESRIRQYN